MKKKRYLRGFHQLFCKSIVKIKIVLQFLCNAASPLKNPSINKDIWTEE